MHKILLVEDESILREPLSIVLRSGSYDVDVASNGVEALTLYQKHTYHLILLDLMMPILDGVGFLRTAALNEQTSPPKVVILSNLSSGIALDTALTLGAHKYVLKSNLTPKDLLNLVRYELSVDNI